MNENRRAHTNAQTKNKLEPRKNVLEISSNLLENNDPFYENKIHKPFIPTPP